MKGRFNQLIIQTPEGVRFVHQLASPVVRFIALAVDLMTISALMSALSVAVGLLGFISTDIAVALSVLLYFLLSIGYFMLLEMVWRGQTLGKRLLRLRVIDAAGLKLSPNQIVLRNLLRFVDSLPVFYFVGGTCALVSRRSQRLGDMAAGTVVVRISNVEAPELSGVLGNYFNSFKEYPRLEALLRQRITPEQSAIALEALRRREEMDPLQRTRLYSELSNFFRGQVPFPEEVTVAMSDEQYLRNCVDTLYRVAK
jgi:uncharacterized RDD family membrane protein YckC